MLFGENLLLTRTISTRLGANQFTLKDVVRNEGYRSTPHIMLYHCNFGFPVVWLRAGDLQLHLFQRDVDPPRRHHFGLTVEDFETVYRKAEELGAFDDVTMGRLISELPDGAVQLYLRDPAGNLVEVDFPDASRLDRRVVKELPKLEDAFPQSDQNRQARLFLGAETRART